MTTKIPNESKPANWGELVDQAKVFAARETTASAALRLDALEVRKARFEFGDWILANFDVRSRLLKDLAADIDYTRDALSRYRSVAKAWPNDEDRYPEGADGLTISFEVYRVLSAQAGKQGKLAELIQTAIREGRDEVTVSTAKRSVGRKVQGLPEGIEDMAPQQAQEAVYKAARSLPELEIVELVKLLSKEHDVAEQVWKDVRTQARGVRTVAGTQTRDAGEVTIINRGPGAYEKAVTDDLEKAHTYVAAALTAAQKITEANRTDEFKANVAAKVGEVKDELDLLANTLGYDMDAELLKFSTMEEHDTDGSDES